MFPIGLNPSRLLYEKSSLSRCVSFENACVCIFLSCWHDDKLRSLKDVNVSNVVLKISFNVHLPRRPLDARERYVMFISE